MKKRGKLVRKVGSLLTAAAVGLSAVSLPVFAAQTVAGGGGAGGNIMNVVAFNGAEGGGMYSQGARGAYNNGGEIEVYHVTNLNDSGEGSFRDAVSKGNRIVVFDVSGYIDLKSNVSISHDNMTILGQTAPGDGICFRSNNVKVGADNVILRYLRFRVGAHDAEGKDTRAQDGMEITDDCENVIIDHCSVSWGTDENLSAYAVKNVTIQRSIIAEALNQSVHDKGEHSYAAIWGGVNLSIHHNLIASHKSRNPKIGTSETVAMTQGYTDDQTLVDMKNNVIYNWGDKAGYGTENGAKTYIQNNVYRPGPATPAGKRSRIFELSVGQKYKPNMLGSVYASGNKIDVDEGDSDYKNAQLVNQNNWQDDLHTGVYVATNVYSVADKTNMKIETPDEQYQEYDNNYPITLDAAEDVYNEVLSDAGATLPKRDEVDTRIIGEVETRTAPIGSKGSVGLVDDPTDCIPEGATNYDGRGYPALAQETRAGDYDADGDGIADTWEDKMGLDKTNPHDSKNIGPDGLTWLEIFVEEAITKTPVTDIEAGISADKNVVQSNQEVNFTVNISGAGVSNIEKAELYCNDKKVGETSSIVNGAAAITVSELPTGDNDFTVKVIKNDGSYIFSPVKTVSVTGDTVPEGWTAENAWYDGDDYTVLDGGKMEKSNISGDYDMVARIDKLSNKNINVQSGISSLDETSGTKFVIGKMYNDNFEQVIYYGEAGNIQIWDGAAKSIEKYKLFKISKSEGVLSLYAGTSLAEWEKVAEVGEQTGNAAVSAYVSAVEQGETVTKFNVCQLVTEQTNPAAKIVNIKNNDRLGLSANVEVKVTPDKGKKVTEVWVYFNGAPLASSTNELDREETINIPVEFTGVAKGTLQVYCFDENLGSGADSVDVVVSQDISPWQIVDIGNAPDDVKAYVLGTNDYTYKIATDTSGSIGGTSDKFGYLCQEFSGDNRIYYRSRMQDGKQMGVVIKNDLTADGVTYYFGGNIGEDGKPRYQLMKRSGAGEEMTLVQDVTDVIGQSANLYFIAEKVGDTINIYQTENGSTVYKTKVLLTSIKCDGIGDSYYMGFGTVSGEGSAASDAGWVSTEELKSFGGGTETYIKSYENGVVNINPGNGFTSGTVIACGYDENGVLVDAKNAEISGESVDVGSVNGDTYKIFLWNNLSDLIPICNPFDGTAQEVSDSSAVEWNFNYGLDWMWQKQEQNVLNPSWTNESIGGNETGKMKISTNSDYSSPRYIFREYILPENSTNIITAGADLMMSGDKTGMNVYLRVKSGDKAFKLSFADDGLVYFGGQSTGYEYSASKWYHIDLVADMGFGGDTAQMVLKDQDGNVCADMSGIESSDFRAQINTEKKYDVTNAVLFEPEAGMTASYYIDNVSVKLSQSSNVKKVLDSHFWNFGSSEEFSGLTSLEGGKTYAGLSVATTGTLESKSKTIDGISFSKRYKIGGPGSKSSKCVSFEVPAGTTDIVVYGEPAGSSGTRSVVINDGSENKTILTTQMSAKYTYTGQATTIYVYGDAGINLYGLSFETYIYE
ncbi:pectate lyase family protein [Monoglobus pectinilyticus]|uniref:Pectate lyase family 1 n=2 Tax=Monoglobus pectinilyticus TaxID=1981510 RepID=A0A2K9P1D0_9FIRM|nr:hypothetical protein [Monoglobus pectinilyticus]AUO19050.1 pectate lyase family 1 [Monoglobus pectinilyticus]